MAQTPTTAGSKQEIISYQKLRTFIGIIGISLPVVLVTISYIKGAGSFSWQPSISHYYYSKMHIVFVGTLCVLGGFLINYKGKDNPWESRVSNLAGFCAFGVAACPTKFSGFLVAANRNNLYLSLSNDISNVMNNTHFTFAGLLFTCFVVFCLKFFQIPDKVYTESIEIEKFKRRKVFYKACGWGIIVSISLLAYFNFCTNREGLLVYTTFCFESTSLFFFGAAWLIKGSAGWKNYPILKSLIKPLR